MIQIIKINGVKGKLIFAYNKQSTYIGWGRRMEKLQLKIGLTDLVYSITVHSFHIFWVGIGLLLIGDIGLVFSGA